MLGAWYLVPASYTTQKIIRMFSNNQRLINLALPPEYLSP